MPPEETPFADTPQPAGDLPSPVVEASAPEPTPVPTESAPAPETAQSPVSTAQIPPNEPIAPNPEPFDSAQDKPTPAPEPPSAAASAPAPVIVQTGILHSARDLLNKARVAIQDRKRKKRDKIMMALNAKNKITNDEVEKLLHVSDATATRYLSALEKEGKIIQVGKQGKGILYIKTP